MFQDELQRRIHYGDKDAFRELYNRYSRDVYSLVYTALGDADTSRNSIKQVFMKLYRELIQTEDDLDLAERLSALTNEEIRLARILSGDFSKDALQVLYTVSVDRDPDTGDTMMRVRSRMMAEEDGGNKLLFPEPSGTEIAESGHRRDALPEERYIAEEKRKSVPKKETGEKLQRPESRKDEQYVGLDLKKEKKRGGSTAVLIILILFVLAFLWLLTGILMDLKIIPFADLGFSFFNRHVFEFFKIPS
ncbi:MAG: hypothetical protein IJK14_02520 [Clostridia bacterium]|nr:hypothetical protein [Clostridia bacterium]MBR0444235.1 hypothetical protein [Clostridia bacterium]